MEMVTDFFVTLPSNNAEGYEIGRYTTRLPTQVRLSGKWTCALTQLLYPHNWCNVTAGESGNNEISVEMEAGRLFAKVFPTYYDSPQELVVGINTAMMNALVLLDNDDVKNSIVFHYAPVYKRIKVVLNHKYVKHITLSKHLQHMLGFHSPLIDKYNTTSTTPLDLRGDIDMMYVYCDVIAPQIVGSSQVPLLQLCSISGKNGEYVEKVFYSPNYVPVVNNDLSKIEITLASSSGMQVQFLYGKIVCVLHFKKNRLML